MANMRFQAILPKGKKMQVGDEIVIKGEIEEGASDLSIKLAAEGHPDDSDIVYHLGLSHGTVFQNSKKNGKWKSQTNLSEAVGYNIFNSYAGNANQFRIVFKFNKEDEIMIYASNSNVDRNWEYTFRNDQPIDAIDNVQLWNGIQNIGEISFVISINFATCRSSDPLNIVYQLRFSYGEIFQNSRINGEWCTGDKEENGDINIFNPDGTNKFCITFFFYNSNEILIYNGDEGRDLQHEFQNEQNIDTIDNVQIWNDLKKIKEIIFRYAS